MLGLGRRSTPSAHRALNPEHPHTAGTAQNPDIFFQNTRSLPTPTTTPSPASSQDVHGEGRRAHRHAATTCSITSALPMRRSVIVTMGSGCDVIEEAINYLNAKGEKVGLVKVRLYRPFAVETLACGDPRHLQRRSLFSTAPRNPAASASPSTTDVVARAGRRPARDIKVLRRPLRPGLQGHSRPPWSRLSTTTWTPTSPRTTSPSASIDDVTHTSLARRREHRTPLRRARSPASSAVSVPTAPSARTRTPSRSSATTPTCIAQGYFAL